MNDYSLTFICSKEVEGLVIYYMDKKMPEIERGHMKRVLGVFDLFAIGYGDLGSSIFYALGITALFALGATPIALLIAGLVFVCTALTYAELSSVIFEAGGSAAFARKAFNDLISFIAGWSLLLDYIVTIAISTFSVAPYLGYFIPTFHKVWPQIIFSLILLLGMLLINILGAKQSTRLSLILTVLAVATQLLIIVIGAITLVHLPEFFSHLMIGGTDRVWSPTWKEFLHGVTMAMVAYTGIESMAQLSAEAHNPSKTVPRAIMLAMGLLLVIYIGLSMVALSAVTPQVLSTKYLEDPISGIVAALPFAKNILGPWISVLASVILVVAANAGVIGASRLSFNMGEYFQLPRFFYQLHAQRKTPYVAIIFFTILAGVIIVLSFGSLAFLADLYNFGAMLAFFCAHISLIRHRIRYPEMKRPFRVPLNIPIAGAKIPITAVIGAIATAIVWILVVVTKPAGRILGVIWMVFGIIMYFYQRRKYEIPAAGHVEIEKIKIEDFKEIEVKKILVPTRGLLSTDTISASCDIAKMFDAELTVVYIVELPYMLPLTTPLLRRETFSEALLNRAKAIAMEKHVPINLKMIKARSIEKTILDFIEKDHFDLVIMGARKTLGPITEKILSSAKCRIWILANEMTTD